MKRLFLSAAVTLLMLKGASVAAAEFPRFELAGFPISPHQISVVGSAKVQEASPTPVLTLCGMPASPHQMAVLTPRTTMAEGMLTVSFTKTAAARH